MSRPIPPRYKTKNWPAYNEALKQRGLLTIWFDPDIRNIGHCQQIVEMIHLADDFL